MAFVVSQGQLTATSWTVAPATAAYLRLADDEYRSYEHLWRTQSQVRTVVSFLARNIAQLGLHVFRRVSDTDRERLTDHPLVDLLTRPSAQMSRYRLIERLVSDLAIYDRAYWVKARTDDGQVASVVPVPPRWVFPEGPSWLEAAEFRIRGSRGEMVLPADQVVHFHGYNPLDARVGASPLEAMEAMLAEEFEASRSRAQMWRNGGRISGVLTRPPDAPKWDTTAKARFGESWKAYTVSGGQAGGTPILEDGMQYQQLALDPAKAQYIEARKLTREEVAAAYHIPLPMVGILDHATFSNIKEQHQQLYQDTLGPWLVSIQDDIALQLIPDLPDSRDVYAEFNMAEKMRGSFEEQAAAASTAAGGPWMTRNEIRARNNLPRIDGGDDLIVPLNVTEGGLASPRDTAPKSLPRTGLSAKSARPSRLGSFTSERDTFAVALTEWTMSQADRLMDAANKKAAREVPDLASLWDAGTQDRITQLESLLAHHGFRLAQVGAWETLAEWNPDADGWSADVMLAWILAAAGTHAAQHEDTGRRAVVQVQATPGDDWQESLKHATNGWVTAAAVRAATASTELRSFGGHDAAGASGLKKKVWRTGGKNPRPSHKAQDGEVVSLDDVFSNGLRWPGDGEGKTAELVNCNCKLDYSQGDD